MTDKKKPSSRPRKSKRVRITVPRFCRFIYFHTEPNMDSCGGGGFARLRVR